MEGLQEVVSMRLDGKDIVYIPNPHLGLAGEHLQGTHLQVFHEGVCHNKSER